MSWVRLDDGFAGHRKVLPLSDAAFRLEVAAICWCNQHANDGTLAAADVRLLCGYLSDPGQAKAAVLELVAAGLWDATETGHRLHDYDKYQPSAQERRASNEAAAERMRKYRERRHGKPADAAQQPAEQASYGVTVTPSYAVTSREVLSSRPDPGPIPARPDPVPVFEEEIPRALARSPSPGPEVEYKPLHGSERQWPAPPPDKQPKPVQPSLLPEADKPPDKLTQAAIGILAELSAARKRVSPGARDLEPSAGNLKHILARLKDRPPQTPDQLRHVIAVAEAQARRDQSLRWFDAATPFRAENIARYLAMDVAEASRRAGGRPGGPWRPDPSVGRNDKSLDERAAELDEWMKR